MTSAMLTTKVFVSPIVASTGLNTKNLLALSRGLPMVTTPDGSHGLKYDHATGAKEGESAPFLVASTAKEFADMVVTLYTNNDQWKEVCVAKFDFVISMSIYMPEVKDSSLHANRDL
jgi:hypothetical protein